MHCSHDHFWWIYLVKMLGFSTFSIVMSICQRGNPKFDACRSPPATSPLDFADVETRKVELFDQWDCTWIIIYGIFMFMRWYTLFLSDYLYVILYHYVLWRLCRGFWNDIICRTILGWISTSTTWKGGVTKMTFLSAWWIPIIHPDWLVKFLISLRWNPSWN